MAFLGVDTGGTFTDFLLLDDAGELHLHKVLSTPYAPEQAILRGIEDMGIDTRGLAITHGSTVATNAILEGKGVATVYVANRGLADVLVIGRQARRRLYDLTPESQPPLLPRERCLEVDSRLAATGEVLARLDAEGLETLLRQLEQAKPAAVAINLLFSFIDDSEEVEIENAVRERFGDRLFVSRSSDVLPEYREYERGVTTTLNAMVGPLMQHYLDKLQQACVGSRIAVMQSAAGATGVDYAGRYPVHLLLSGPAGGLIGAKTAAADRRLLTFDMGGTSTDVSIIDGEIGFRHSGEIAGYPVGVSMVDMHTIGAGGGSIARVDDAGLLLVGPQSAGADPGPACYGRGGILPTVTDANVVLGRLLPEVFLGGSMTLDRAASERAVQGIADRLGIGLVEAARGIIDVVNDHMVRALRVVSVQRGEDPKDYTLVSFGGAGGLHVCALAEALDMSHAMVPVYAGVLSALGMLSAEQVRERSRSITRLLVDSTASRLQQVFDELAGQAGDELLADREDRDRQASAASTRFLYSVDARYAGQSHTLNLAWRGTEHLGPDFHRAHRESYGHELDIDIELVNLRVRAVLQNDIGGANGFSLPAWRPLEAGRPSVSAMPDLASAVDVINRAGLDCGQELHGPLLITETSSTTWLAAGWLAKVDDRGNLQLQKLNTLAEQAVVAP